LHQQDDQTATGRPSCFRRFIPGIAIYYYFARSNKFILDLLLECAIPSLRNRIYSGNKVIPEIRHIYPWNRVIPPFRNRPLDVICSSKLTVLFIQATFSEKISFPEKKYFLTIAFNLAN